MMNKLEKNITNLNWINQNFTKESKIKIRNQNSKD
jgi:hypothetical protein